jgi:uncharacterized membrane protein
MEPSHAYLLAFVIGVLAGLRSLTPAAVISWAAHRQALSLHGTPLSFLSSTPAVLIFSLFALIELVGDKLSFAPSRTDPPGLIARIVLGGLAGAALALSGGQSLLAGAVLGAVGGVAGTYGGHYLRVSLVKALKVPDVAIALLEDLVAIGGSVLIAFRF